MGMATSRHTLLDGATVRNIFTGHSGYMGLTAVRLVECGFTGEIDGVGNVYGKVLSDTFDPDKAIAGLGTEWLIAQSYFKLHPTGRYVHSAIDALEDLLSRVPGGRLDAGEHRAHRGAHLRARGDARREARRVELRLAFLGAVRAREHSASRTLGIRKLRRCGGRECPTVQALAQRVDLQEDKAHTARYPKETPCDVRIVMRDGTVHEGQCVVMKGEPGNPHKPEELKRKFFELGTPVWGEATTRKLFDGLMDVENIRDFGAFAERIQALKPETHSGE